jgi:hypothetical protein
VVQYSAVDGSLAQLLDLQGQRNVVEQGVDPRVDLLAGGLAC